MRRLVIVPFVAASLACALFSAAEIPPLPPTETPTETPTLTPSPTPTETPTPTPTPVHALPNAGGYQWTLVASGLNDPVDLTHAGDDRVFIVEQRGVIRVLQGGQLRPEPFLDITDRVNRNASERGLLGLAFHPDYAGNQRFFVNYTGQNGDTFISEFLARPDPAFADASSERVLLRIPQPFPNHNGGAMAFGPDGYLYIGVGDGGSAGDPQEHGQNPFTRLGTILRIDVDTGDPYGVPPDNPFLNGGGLSEVWAYGLRNPWRIAFDRVTGDLYIADVGQRAWEEINVEPADSPGGVNYGWNIREGAHAFAGQGTQGLVDPAAEYSHDFGCSVTGGVVVRSPNLPEWNGVYLYGDYCSGLVWGLVRDAQAAWLSGIVFQTGLNISSFGQDAAGEVYVVDHRGAVYRLEPIP